MILKMKVPSPGESIREVEITTWLVKDGDYVEKDQAIAEVDSDKATLELPAEASGIITLIAEEGDAVAVGAVLCLIDTSAGSATEVKVEVPKTAEKKVEAPKVDSAPETYPTQKTSPASHNVTRTNESTRTNKSTIMNKKVKEETDSNSGFLIIIVLIICAVLGFSFYESERRKESIENIPVNYLKVLDPSDIHNVEKKDQTEPNSDNNQSETSTSDYNNSNDNNQSKSESSASDYNTNDNNHLIICPNCNGSRLVDIRCCVNLSQKCNLCDKNGWRRGKCPVCNGTGRVKEYE